MGIEKHSLLFSINWDRKEKANQNNYLQHKKKYLTYKLIKSHQT